LERVSKRNAGIDTNFVDEEIAKSSMPVGSEELKEFEPRDAAATR